MGFDGAELKRRSEENNERKKNKVFSFIHSHIKNVLNALKKDSFVIYLSKKYKTSTFYSLPTGGKALTIIFFLTIPILVWNIDTSNHKSGQANKDAEVEARVLCRTLIEQAANYGVDISFTDGTPVDMNDKINVYFQNFKMQNGFGAWKKCSAICQYDKKSNEVLVLNVDGNTVYDVR
jgi:hypothetical protein